MQKAFRFLCVFMSFVIIISSVGLVFAVAVSGDGPEFDIFSCNDIVDKIKNMEMNMTSVIYVQNDEDEWVEYQRIHGNENRLWVDMDKIPKDLINAFVAIEDQRFYSHGGVDWKRTAAAFLDWIPNVNLLSGSQGGSSITQQLIKNLTSDKEKSATRKIREIIRALFIEKMLDKDVILEAYLNTINLGGRNCGVQVAANYYFNKDVDELNLAECACIAAITKNPSKYKPDVFPEQNAERRRLVLDEMYDNKMISEDEYTEAYEAEILIDKTQQSNFEIPINSYFVETLIENVTEDLAEKYNCSIDVAETRLYNGGYKIYATLDTDIQKSIDKVYTNVNTYFSQKAKGDKTKHAQSGITIMDYEGHIVGISGGAGQKTVNKGLNRAYDIPRQPGSTMKPIGAYAPALDNGTITYSSKLIDEPLKNYYSTGKSGPKEWYGYYEGSITLARALERSANTVPCHVVKEMGITTSFDFLTSKLQMKHLTDKDKNLSALALGGCSYGITPTESAAAFAIFGNGGKYYKPITYYKVENSNNEIVLNSDIEGTQVIKPSTASVMNKLLQNVVYGAQGTGSRIRGYSSMKAYGKTGTSTEANDLWMVAGSPYYVASVWYGFDKPQAVHNTGSAGNIWRIIMTEVHKGLEKKEFEEAESMITAKYCTNTGLLAGKKCRSTAVGYYVEGVTVETCSGKHTAEPAASNQSEETPSSTTENSANPSSDASTAEPTEAPSSTVPSSSDSGTTGDETEKDPVDGETNEGEGATGGEGNGEGEATENPTTSPTTPPSETPSSSQQTEQP